MSDMYLGSQAPFTQNVTITKRTVKGKELEKQVSKNRITKLMLFGIARFLKGEFNDSTPDKIYEYIPRYLALGTNKPGIDSATAGVTVLSNVTDTRLLNEITVSNSTGRTEPVKRISIAERNMCKINSKFSDPFIKVSIKCYVSEPTYDGMTIAECGLFSKERDNNCLARVCFNPITKNPGEVLDIQWDITLLSYGETKYPDSISIENGSKVTIPLQYTNKKFKEIKIGLKKDTFGPYLGLHSEVLNNLFKIDQTTGNITLRTSINPSEQTALDQALVSWKLYITDQELNADNVLLWLLNSKVNSIDEPLYLISQTQDLSYPFYFGNLYENQDMDFIANEEMAVFLMYTEDQIPTYTDTDYRFGPTEDERILSIKMPNGNSTTYRVFNNRVEKAVPNATSWQPLNYFMYKGLIVDEYGRPTKWTYEEDGKFYEVEYEVNDLYVNQYLNYSNDDKMHLNKLNDYNIIQYSGFSFDLKKDAKIYENEEYSLYHLSLDNYWVMGDYVKLIPIINPKDATDRSVKWVIQNTDIAKINWDGVVEAWNLGETTAIVSTVNDLRAKCIVEVIKEERYVAVDSVRVEPKEITLIVDGDSNQFHIVKAFVEPLFASNSTVRWTVSSEINQCITILNIGDNSVKVVLNGSGNIGTGWIQATAQSGKSDTCLVKIIYSKDADDCDCPDPSHTLMQI